MAPGTTEANAPGYFPTYVDLLGTPFKIGGRGPENYDCYGLVMELHRRLGLAIPDVRSPQEQIKMASVVETEVPAWTKCKIGRGSVITFQIGRHISHVGMMINDWQFLHVWEGASLGVAVERLSNWERRVAGSYRYNK